MRGNDNNRICLLSGHAGTGKSTIAHTIAEQCDQENLLGFSFFFSRRSRDRSDGTKFIPTLAYQLSVFLPTVQDAMKSALERNGSIFHQNPKAQLTKLVIEPLLSIVDSLSTMIIVVDGLDEYDGNLPLADLVVLFRDLPDRLPFRIFFTSRPEARILEIFNTSSLARQTYRLALQDFSSRYEVEDLLRSRLLTVREKRGLPSTWPSAADLNRLSKQSGGLYIYAETLIRFIDDEYGSPPERLQSALDTFSGIDHLYHKVLREARRYPAFAQVMGRVIYLGEPLNIGPLSVLLRLPSLTIRLALRGCLSVLVIPDDDEDYIRPYHASLRDLFADRDRAEVHFLDPLHYNLSIMDDCINLLRGSLAIDAQGREPVRYACRYWCHHLRLVISCTSGVDHVESDVKRRIVEVVKALQSQWFKNWMIILGDRTEVESVHEDLRTVVTQFEVCRPEAVLRLMNAYLAKEESAVFPELQEAYETVHVSLEVVPKNRWLNRNLDIGSRCHVSSFLQLIVHRYPLSSCVGVSCVSTIPC
jgi:hypothetical protein